MRRLRSGRNRRSSYSGGFPESDGIICSTVWRLCERMEPKCSSGLAWKANSQSTSASRCACLPKPEFESLSTSTSHASSADGQSGCSWRCRMTSRSTLLHSALARRTELISTCATASLEDEVDPDLEGWEIGGDAPMSARKSSEQSLRVVRGSRSEV